MSAFLLRVCGFVEVLPARFLECWYWWAWVDGCNQTADIWLAYRTETGPEPSADCAPPLWRKKKTGQIFICYFTTRSHEVWESVISSRAYITTWTVNNTVNRSFILIQFVDVSYPSFGQWLGWSEWWHGAGRCPQRGFPLLSCASFPQPFYGS